jgi:predicted dehydrogenase
MFRSHPQHQKVKELINDGKIGEMESFNGVFGFPAFPEGDIRYDAGLGGGFLNDSGCYPICASRMIFNEEPVTVGCQFNLNSAGVDVKGTSFLIYKNQKSATITYGNGNYYQAKYEVWGSDGVISLDRAYSVPSDFTTKVNLQHNTENNWEGRRNEIFEIQPKDHFLEILDTFCMEITGSEKTPFNFEEELLNQAKVMEAHRQSAITAKMIWLSEL